VGFNSRLDEFQAAILRIKFPHLEAWNEARIAHAARYADRLARAPVRLPRAAADQSHIYHLYTICSDRRDALRDHLRAKGIGCEVYYPRPLHLQGAYRQFGYQPGDLPRAEACSRKALSLPMYPELTDAQIEVVAEAVLSFASSDQEVA
jgi:dTDP-4-amino-4,6-dideoxygalactose transaminase